jgi:hydroxymethylpyrimidine/phosphomethylpyrimidine kinase
MGRICGLCTQLRSRGPLCAVHGEDVPSIRPDRCSFCLEDLADIRYRTLEDHKIVEDLRRAVQMIESTGEMAALIPEIGMNVVYAKPEASAMEEVVGVPGRIRPLRGSPRASSAPEFGGSSHVSRAALTMMRYEPSMLSAISLKFDWDLVEICREIGLTVSFFDRREEPPEVKRVDGRTIPWGVRRAVEAIGGAPDVVYDEGDIGKEPMIFLFGRTPQEVAHRAIRIATEHAERRDED